MSAKLVHFPSQASARVKRLRERILAAPQEVCIERARYLTQSIAAHWDKHPLTRMSLALENILSNMSVIIREGELIVGCRTSKLKGAPLFPENKSRWLEGDVEGFDLREVQRALITEDEKRELLDTILPFWHGRTVEDYFESLLPKDVYDDMDKYVFTILLQITYGVGHFTMNHGRILSGGLGGLIEEAERRRDALTMEEREGETGRFFEAVIRSLRAAIALSHRYADKAETLANEETDPTRARELREIVRICRKVPEKPAETFHEAVQSVYFIHLISQIESGGNSISLGRIDQILYPYYRSDLERGKITPAAAKELLSLLFIKCNEIWNVLEEAYIPGGEGTEGKTTQNVVVGGMGSDGRDAVNDLSYVGLEAYADIRTVQPNFGVRISRDCPEDFFLSAVRCAKEGVLLHFFNDEAIVRSLVEAGHTLEDARDYGVVGCLEPNAQGKSFASTFAVQFSGIKCLEYALAGGIDNIFGFPAGIDTGDPADFSTFDDLWAAYDRQVNHFIHHLTIGMGCLDRAIAEMLPSPFASAMIDGPLEKGKDLTKGGAIYNSTGVQFMGFSNVADSLTAVKKTVFEEKRFTMADVAEWLAEDWLDAEDKRMYLKSRAPKYGNDNDEADRMAEHVLNHFCDGLAVYRNWRGGTYWPGVFSVGFHNTMGAFTGATPDGRFAGEVLGNGITPSNSAALTGPTAIMNSVTKLPLHRVTNGLNLNMRLSGGKIKPEKLRSLIRGYFDRGGVQVQFNMVDSETLRAAQEDPDQYRDLIVRISGYSGIFVNLSDLAQEEIIQRTVCEL